MTSDSTDPASIIRKAMRLYLDNHRDEAHKMLETAAKDREAARAHGPDASSLFRSIWALVDLIEGLLSGSADTIANCIDGFWAAEKLANESTDKEWIGNRISRGLSYMFGGLVQVFIGSYVKAGVNLTVAAKLIRDLEKDVLDYSDPRDKDLIRSLGLLVLAMLNFFSVILPPSIVAIGEFLGVGLSEAKFNEYVSLCNKEGGTFAYISKLIQVYSLINSKNFMFNKITEVELTRCRTLMNECLRDAPNSVVIHVMNASVCLGEGKPKEAVATLTKKEVTATIEKPEWATMALAVLFKLGVAHLCDFKFDSAEAAFRKAADAIDKSGRWHYIPFMRSLEGLSYLAHVSSIAERPGVSAIREKAERIFRPTLESHSLMNTIVLPGDYWGARVGFEYMTLLASSSDEELLGALDAKAPVVDALYALLGCLYQFDKIDSEKLGQFVESVKGCKKTAKLSAVTGEYYRKVGKWSQAVSAFDDALACADEFVNEGEPDRDSVIAFSLIFQGASLCFAGELETAKEVFADLDEELDRPEPVGALFGWGKVKGPIQAGNLVKPSGKELDLIISFRRNGLKRKIAELSSAS